MRFVRALTTRNKQRPQQVEANHTACQLPRAAIHSPKTPYELDINHLKLHKHCHVGLLLLGPPRATGGGEPSGRGEGRVWRSLHTHDIAKNNVAVGKHLFTAGSSLFLYWARSRSISLQGSKRGYGTYTTCMP